MLEAIKSLNVSNKKKAELQWIHDNAEYVASLHVDKNMWANRKVSMKYSSSERFKLNMKALSFWPFLFSTLIYLFKGMWKKFLSLTLLSILCFVIAVVLAGAGFVTAGQYFNFVSQVLIVIICVNSYKWDSYRKLVLKEDFWW